MNQIRYFDKQQDLSTLEKWINDWSVNPIILSTLPEIGIIAENIAVIFLYETNSSIAFIEGLFCNKDIDKDVRDTYIDLICDVIIEVARHKGYKHIVSYTKHQAVVDRAIKHGFKTEDRYHCLFKTLNDNGRNI